MCSPTSNQLFIDDLGGRCRNGGLGVSWRDGRVTRNPAKEEKNGQCEENERCALHLFSIISCFTLCVCVCVCVHSHVTNWIDPILTFCLILPSLPHLISPSPQIFTSIPLSTTSAVNQSLLPYGFPSPPFKSPSPSCHPSFFSLPSASPTSLSHLSVRENQ